MKKIIFFFKKLFGVEKEKVKHLADSNPKSKSKRKPKTKKKVSKLNHSVKYDFSDTLIFYKLANEKFPNHPILIKSKQSFFKIFNNNDINKLKKI